MLCYKQINIYNSLFVETPRKFITAKLSIRKPGSSSVLIICDLFCDLFCLSGLTDRKLCSNKFTWCFHKQTIICFIAMQTYKELIRLIFIVYLIVNFH